MLAIMSKTDKRQEVLNAVGTEWLSRSQIAAKLGKTTLNPSEVKYLEDLVANGALRRKIELAGIAEKFLYCKA